MCTSPPAPGAGRARRQRRAIQYRRGVDERAREALHVSVGLAVLGLQRWLSVRKDIEAELDRIGLGPAAEVSRRVGDAVANQIARLLAAPPSGRA